MRAGDCRHFTGILHKTCAAGVTYESVKDKSQPGMVRLPCIKSRPTEVVCAKFSATTKEEEADFKRQVDDSIKRMGRARAAVVATKQQAGAIDCPVCSTPKALRFTVSSYNGHIHAACDTKGCVSWME